MPGIVGVVGTRGPEDAVRRFNVARDRMLRHAGSSAASTSAADGSWWFGRIDLFDRGTVASVAFTGVLYNECELRTAMGDGAALDSTETLVETLYQRYGPSFVERLEGEFALAVVDAPARRVLLATDPIGNYQICWRADVDGLVFASDLSALLRASRTTPRLDLRAVSDYLTFGAVLQDRTLAEGVRLLDPGTILIYDADTLTATSRTYWRLEALFDDPVHDQARYFEDLEGTFGTVVRRAGTSQRQMGLSLSGGLDSRGLLSQLSDLGPTLRTYTLGVEGCADEAIAARLSRMARTTHTFFRLDDSYLRDFLPNMARMVSMTDGMYLSHGLTEMLVVQFLADTGIQVLLRGHGGEVAKAHLAWPLHTDERVGAMTTLKELVPYLSARANYVTPGLPLSRVFTPEAARAAGGGAAESFESALKGTHLNPAQACTFLYLRELHRRFTVPSVELFRTRSEVRMPYVAPSFLQVLLRAPAAWRDSTVIHRRLIAAGNSKLLKVRNSNTGAPADAGPNLEFVMDKVNTLLKRLNVPGYRHYHSFDAWMRQNLLESVEAELLAPAARVQAFVPRATLALLVDETRRAAADHSYLLQILLILELWQRENGVEAAA